MEWIKKLKKYYKQSECQHTISDNYACGGSCGPNVWDNYTMYSCMLCGKLIKYIGKTPLGTNTINQTK